MDIKIPFLTPYKLCFDLGTATTRIAIKDKGIILREPTFIGYNVRTKEPIFFGAEARNVMGKTPDFIKIVKPMVAGIISDFDAQVSLVKYFLDKSVSPYFNQYKFLKPKLEAYVTNPVVATEIEQKATEEVLLKAGCSSVFMLERPVVTAAGCGVDVFSHYPHAVVDLGAGLIDISIVSGGGVVINKNLKAAGVNMNKLIANYAYLKHGIILGELTCEKLKTSLLNFINDEKIILVRGKSLETGLPKSVKLKTSEILEALLNNFNQIIETIKEVIELSPPEIIDEIFNEGIYLTGGLSLIPGIADFFSKELKMKIITDPNFADATINGLLFLSARREYLDKFKSYKYF